MSDLNNGAVVDGGEDTIVSEKPVSVRDSLVAAMKEAPAESTEPTADNRARDEAGRFTQKPADPKAVAAAPQQPAQQQATSPAPKPAESAATQPTAQPVVQPAHKAPPGWSAEAKASFDTLPDHVKAAISNREQEVDNGFKVLQDYKGLEEFTPYVKAANTTFAASMKRALDWEASLQRDPFRTVHHVATIIQQRTNLPVDKILHPDLVAHLGQQAPQQQPAPRQQPQPQPVNVDAVVDQAFRKRDIETQLNSFLSDPANVHADAVLEDMATLISTGRAKDLRDAYDTACWMRPDIRQQLINQAAPAQQHDEQARRAAAADQARRASKSITGSSAPGPSANAGAGKSSSLRDTLKEAMAAQGGRV
ncbi:hypothetical protein G6M50_38110 [Agrobacterium rhizogenes]|nr:hypothetical protein [Rhizobium rhizogenes]NTJ83605.1 hypothetical protein [Rhizobium rhizogenes]